MCGSAGSDDGSSIAHSIVRGELDRLMRQPKGIGDCDFTGHVIIRFTTPGGVNFSAWVMGVPASHDEDHVIVAVNHLRPGSDRP
jgi:hypothetical protein